MCHRLRDIPVPDPVPLTQNRGWVAGVIQADGYIGLDNGLRANGSRYPSAVISFVNSEHDVVRAVAAPFPSRGRIHRQQPPVGLEQLVWRVRSQPDVEAVGAYLQSVPFFGPKARRVTLILGKFYGLRDQGAHKVTSPLHPQ